MVKKVVKRETTTEHVEETKETKKPKVKKVTTTTTTTTTPKKKRKKRKSSTKKRSSSKKLTAREREEMLIENFVGLQHAMTNLSIKFGALSDNISNLLMVFEEAAKNFAQGGRPDDKDLLKKINSLLDQNKTIARGLVLMEGKLRGREAANNAVAMQQQPIPTPPQQQPPVQQDMQSTSSLGTPSTMHQDTTETTSRPRPLPSI